MTNKSQSPIFSLLSKVQLGFALALILFVLFGVASIQAIRSLVDLTELDRRTSELLVILQQLRTDLATSGPQAAERIQAAIGVLPTLIDDDKNQQDHWSELNRDINHITGKIKIGNPLPSDSPIFSTISMIEKHEADRRNGIALAVRHHFDQVRYIFLGGSILAFVTVGVAWFTIRRDDAARVRAEERLALALEGSRDGLWDLNVPTGELYVNPSWRIMFPRRNKRSVSWSGLNGRKNTGSFQPRTWPNVLTGMTTWIVFARYFANANPKASRCGSGSMPEAWNVNLR